MKKLNLFLLFTIFFATSLFSQQRNVRPISVKTKEGQYISLYTNSYALVIGVSDYTEGWPDLPNAVKDADEVKAALEQHGFIVTLLINPTATTLKNGIDDFFAFSGLNADNRLLFYFAGHGHTIKKTYGQDVGYIVPADAPLQSVDPAGFIRKAISMESFNTYARNIDAKHALFLFDCCFSGSIFVLSRALPDAISYKTREPVRQFITAGQEDETVPDRSIFKSQFIAALQGEGDGDGDGYLTGTELGLFLQNKVINYSRESQHPQFGKIRDPRLDKGDFVFIIPKQAEPERNINLPLVDTETSAPAETRSLNTPILRKTPLAISDDAVKAMLQDKKLFDSELNVVGEGFDNDFELQKDGQVIYDRNSGLMWQQSGSFYLNFENAKKYINKLNNEHFAGCINWRLPTLEEAMSLMEREKSNDDLYIDQKFNKSQIWMWTSDLNQDGSRPWVISFDKGYCYWLDIDNIYFVRAVRSVQSSIE